VVSALTRKIPAPVDPPPANAAEDALALEARLTAMIERQAMLFAELRHDVDCLIAANAQSAQRAKNAPEGHVPLKSAASLANFSAEMVRIWAVLGVIGSTRQGGQWFVDLESLQQFVALSPAKRGALVQKAKSAKRVGHESATLGQFASRSV
jgi:hypothetical protein